MHGIRPNLEIYTTLVVACAKNQNPEEAERVVLEMKNGKHIHPSASLNYNIFQY